MQDYLISQVLFDGKEDVRSSKMTTANKGDGDAKRVEEEHKQKEIEMVNREYELRKKIEQEMAEIKRKEEESKMKLKEAEFEAYKKEMEKYLNFVCEDKEEEDKVKKKTSTSKKKGKIEPTKKLTVNIESIKSQFEKDNEFGPSTTSSIKTPQLQINKLNQNIFNQKCSEDEKSKKKKEYVPIIIDRDAFERTKCTFEKEMEEEKERLIKEKEEREKIYQEQLKSKELEKQ